MRIYGVKVQLEGGITEPGSSIPPILEGYSNLLRIYPSYTPCRVDKRG